MQSPPPQSPRSPKPPPLLLPRSPRSPNHPPPPLLRSPPVSHPGPPANGFPAKHAATKQTQSMLQINNLEKVQTHQQTRETHPSHRHQGCRASGLSTAVPLPARPASSPARFQPAHPASALAPTAPARCREPACRSSPSAAANKSPESHSTPGSSWKSAATTSDPP